jgi:DNA-binding response OmpR family regulator
MNDDALTVLVIEDEDFISSMISRSLKEEGYQVIVTSDLKSSLIVLDSGAIDLVISDVMLPFTGGLDIVDYIRDHDELEETPIILVTGMDKDVLETSSLRANAILSKPFDMIALIDKVDELLGKTEKEEN